MPGNPAGLEKQSLLTGTAFVAMVRKALGWPYVYGGDTAGGVDCSGLVYWALQQLGISDPPRTSEEQYAWATPIQASQLQPGDLIFLQFPGDNAAPGHVVVYTGNGQVIQAPHPGANVETSSWPGAAQGGQIIGYGRVPGLSYSGISPGGSGLLGDLGGLVGSVTAVPEFLGSLAPMVQAAMWLINPANWVRIVAGLLGFVLLILALVMLAKAA